MKQLEGLRFHQQGISHLGCIKGCLGYLGIDVSWPWLYGGTAHAFAINIDEAVDVAGVTAWNAQMLFDLAPNLGYAVDGLSVWKHEAGDAYPERQRQAWDLVRAAIDRGLPCYGWELKAPYGDWWVITGYDDVGYYYDGWEAGGPLPWNRLGDQFVPLLEVHSVGPHEPAPDDVVVAQALRMALKHAANPPEWIEPRSRSGPAAYEHWAGFLEAGTAKRDHHTYNAQVWLECREMAVAFLHEVQTRLPGRCDALIDEAAGHYALVRDRLQALLELHPPREHAHWDAPGDWGSTEAAALVRQAGSAERRALACLQRIVDALR